MLTDHKHQIQYLFPLASSVPQVVAQASFTANNLTNLTDKLCIDLFSPVLSDTSDTSPPAANSYSPDPAAEETNE